jgi:cysteine desulfurase family protein (TIGR01976 family)
MELSADQLEALRARLRAHFAPLSAPGAVAFLDNAAGTLVPRGVAAAVADALTTRGVVNSLPGYALGRAQAATKLAAHEATAVFVNARGADEIALGPSATAMAFRLSAALARQMRAGEAVVVSELEHECNASPWRDLARVGVELRIWRARWPAGELRVEDLEALLADGKVRLVALTQASNAFGLLTRPAEAARAAHAHGALIIVDSVHGAPHMLPDVQRDDLDFMLFSPYKIMAPHLGALYMRRTLVAGLDTPTLCFYDRAHVSKFELGTPAFEALAGWIAALRYIAAEVGAGGGAAEEVDGGAPPTRAALERGYAVIEALEAPTKEMLVRGLAAIDGVTVFGSQELAARVGTVAFRVRELDPAAVALALGELGVCVGNGHFYALLPCGALGVLETGGVVRASLAHYSSKADVQRLLDGVASIAHAGSR